MTPLLQTAMEKAKKLPDAEQDKIAALVLEAIEDETGGADRHWIGGRKPTKEETACAMDRWRDALYLDLALREGLPLPVWMVRYAPLQIMLVWR